MAATRSVVQEAVVELLARSCRVHPMGFAHIEGAAMAAAAREVAVKALARVVMMIGGSTKECAPDSARRVYDRLFPPAGKAAATLGRCLLVARGPHLLVCRERRDLPAPRLLFPGDELLWDGRFRLSVIAPRKNAVRLYVRPLERDDWRVLCSNSAKLVKHVPPALVRGTLPILSDDRGLAIAPHFDYVRDDLASTGPVIAKAMWRPRQCVTGPGYFLV
jgi:tRNA(Ile)-lysidine synthase